MQNLMQQDIRNYLDKLAPADQVIGEMLYREICTALPEAEHKIWHAHPVWFLDGNPVVGFSKLKDSIRLLFWSGQSFAVPGLKPEGSFKAAEARFTQTAQINPELLGQWLSESRDIQWDYKNIVRRKGVLERLK